MKDHVSVEMTDPCRSVEELASGYAGLPAMRGVRARPMTSKHLISVGAVAARRYGIAARSWGEAVREPGRPGVRSRGMW